MEMRSTLPPLVPRSTVPRSESLVNPTTKETETRHTEAEWSAVYPEIERMYVHERRKLRHIMQQMEERHAFKATVQMYKKRFAKWGFQKNTRRSLANTKGSSSSRCVAQRPLRLSPPPTLSGQHRVNLAFLSAIRSWSLAYFEPVKPSAAHTSGRFKRGNTVVTHRPRRNIIYDPEQLSFAFRVIVGLLQRGHGVLAGRLARKAFLQIEGLMTTESPLFIWNILEILHSTVSLGQTDLFRMLLKHTISLARSHHHLSTHPAIVMLRSLDSLVEYWPNDASGAKSMAAALAQAWALNSDILFANFDMKFLHLYYLVIWDSALVRISSDKMNMLDAWFLLADAGVPKDVASLVEFASQHEIPYEPRGSTGALPENYHAMKAKILADVHHLNTLDFQDPKTKFNVLSAILKGRIFREDDGNVSLSSDGSPPSSHSSLGSGDTNDTCSILEPRQRVPVPKIHARILAYMAKMVERTEVELGYSPEAIIPRMKSVLALRAYGQNSGDPQTVHDLWLLEELLSQVGNLEEAAAVRRDALRRLEQYLDDVPISEV